MRRFIITLFLSVFILILIYLLFFSSVFRVKTIVVENAPLTKDSIEELGAEYIGDNLFLFDKRSFVQNIQQMSMVESVRVKRKLRNVIYVSVIEYEPVANVVHGSEKAVVDRNGTVLLKDTTLDYVQNITGFQIEVAELGEVLNTKHFSILTKALDLCELLSQTTLKGGWVQLVGIDLRYYINNDFFVSFGKGDEITEKFNLFMTTYESLVSDGVDKGSIRVLDNNSVVFRPFEEKE